MAGRQNGRVKMRVVRDSGRVAVAFAILAIVLEIGALAFYAAADGFAPALSVPPTTLLASGPGGAELIRWGSLVDMFGYLCLPPVVLYLRNRYVDAKFIDAYAVAGFGLAVIGSIGAVVMMVAAPPLINLYQMASAAERQTLALLFGTLYRAVVEGMWQTLETIPAAIWLLGTAFAARGKAPRSVFWILLVAGLANAGIALFRLSQV
jgi:hypothetical protein